MAEGDDIPKQPAAPPTAAEDGATLEERVRALEEALAAAREEARQNHERWRRERADNENLKKRMVRERAETIRFGIEQVLRDLLPVVDNLERAVEHARGGGDGAPLVEGVTLVLKGLLDVLERHGVSRVEAEGKPFDPARHEAMAHVESAEHPPNSVVEEHQRGYLLHERLLRPALVTVAKRPSDEGNLVSGKDRD
jgi:molecular chaperone GrpE